MALKFAVFAALLARKSPNSRISENFQKFCKNSDIFLSNLGGTVRSAPLCAVRAGIIGAPVAYAAPSAPVAYAAPLAKAVVADEYDPNPQYSYGYQVQDSLTGDAKSKSETRSGDSVQGSYSLVDPDGTLRTVEYTADPVNGFNAVVSRQPLAAKAVVAAHAPVAYAAPVAKAILH
ncbi:hypothetical protein NQ318_007188 [Aromia moschata]|uniref:Uncharacterized protein n=1 Tax=Aromia moschata TaxID=1265417 RepID=A0AAV8XZM6_9CUCU|nr:hypothetical protein NQ318_007188 [Aromia moschata]